MHFIEEEKFVFRRNMLNILLLVATVHKNTYDNASTILLVLCSQVHDDENHKIVVNEDGFHSLIIYVTQKWDAGLYTCIARNRGGEDRFQVTLNVTGKDSFDVRGSLGVVGGMESIYEQEPSHRMLKAHRIQTLNLGHFKDISLS